MTSRGALPFLTLSPTERGEAFVAAGARRRVSPVLLEKDLWVCWVLDAMFRLPGIGEHLVFKGGTSLSKVYGAIDRFSEDVDVSLAPALVGEAEDLFDRLSSRTCRDEALLRLQSACLDFTRAHLIAPLERALVDDLGVAPRGAWLELDAEAAAAGSPVVHFHYPGSNLSGLSYIRPAVKLELGSLTDQRPVGLYPVRPWLADDFPAAFEGWSCETTALELERTFWEKATILHCEHHRPADQAMPDRYARHYSDLARLLDRPDGQAALVNKDLCARVAVWKSHVFGRRWASYETARPGSFRLMPPPSRRDELGNDYARMRDMFLTEPPSFDDVLARLAEAEATINAA